METKQCTRCKEVKLANLECFNPHTTTKNGLSSWCRKCHHEYSKTDTGKATTNKAVKKMNASVPPGVYMIKNLITGDFYIGKSVKPYLRMSQHLSKNYYTSSVFKVYEAVKQYGKENFITGIVEHCDKHSLLEKERYYIKTLKPTYNIR